MPITVISNLESIPQNLLGGVIAIGNFDGVHLAHQQLLKSAIHIAKTLNTFSAVFTFDPHPREFFSKAPIAFLTTFDEKVAILEEMGIEVVYKIPFDENFAKMEAHEFADLLFLATKAVHILCGYNFRFGHNRVGDPSLLNEKAAFYGASCSIINSLAINSKLVSSSYIKTLLHRGCTVRAATVLGRPYSMEAVLLKKENTTLKAIINANYSPLLAGSYCARVTLKNKQEFWGVVEIAEYGATMKNCLINVYMSDNCSLEENDSFRIELYDLLHPMLRDDPIKEQQRQRREDLQSVIYLKRFI